MVSFARSERQALGNTALSLGPDAPTLCTDWTVKDLVIHLLVRERRPWAAPGIFIKSLAPLRQRAERAYAGQSLPELVERFRNPSGTHAAIEQVDRLMNTVELFVHHEDLRRAQPGWSPRTLSTGESAELMGALRLLGRGLV
ncbi:MAG: TIGR03085 family protein, partial [Nocardioides sp.]|nr:TIGR03085 family protein [Nocardioides sp.]